MPGEAFTIQVRGNTLEASTFVRTLASKHVPFATAASLTELAKEARDELRGGLRDRFTVRAKRFPQTVRHVPAEKRDWPRTFSVVGILDEWAARHEAGGVVRPDRSNRWAIPGRSIKRTSSGKIRKRQRPKALLEAGGFERDGSILVPFGRGGSRLRVAYTLRKKARLEPRLEGRRTVSRVAGDRFSPLFKKWMLRALT